MTEADYFIMIGLALAVVIADIGIRFWKETIDRKNRNKFKQ